MLNAHSSKPLDEDNKNYELYNNIHALLHSNMVTTGTTHISKNTADVRVKREKPKRYN